MKLNLIIKNLRSKKGFTQSELSEKSGVSLRTIQRIERDEVSPSMYTLKKISEVLNEDLNQIKYDKMKNKLKIKTTYLLVLLGIVFLTVGVYYFGSEDLNRESKVVKGYPLNHKTNKDEVVVVKGYPLNHKTNKDEVVVVKGYPLNHKTNKDEVKVVKGHSLKKQ